MAQRLIERRFVHPRWPMMMLRGSDGGSGGDLQGMVDDACGGRRCGGGGRLIIAAFAILR
jgi:hypothetical protein